MIFGGYGRKTKVRGEIFFPCFECGALNPFGLVENYGYGQVYGVRLAKYGTNRMMLCAHCQEGYGLEKQQWDHAMATSKSLRSRGLENLTMKEMAESAVQLAQVCFPDQAEDVRGVLWEQLGNPRPVEDVGEAVLEEAPAAIEGPKVATKICPDCAEEVKGAARKCRFCGYLFQPEDGLEPEAREMLAVTPVPATLGEQVELADDEGGRFGFRLLAVHDSTQPTSDELGLDRGCRYVGVELELTNLSSEEAWTSITAVVVDDEKKIYEIAAAEKHPDFNPEPELSADETRRGFLLFEMPVSARPAHLRLGLDCTRAVADWPLGAADADGSLVPVPEPAT